MSRFIDNLSVILDIFHVPQVGNTWIIDTLTSFEAIKIIMLSVDNFYLKLDFHLSLGLSHGEKSDRK